MAVQRADHGDVRAKLVADDLQEVTVQIGRLLAGHGPVQRKADGVQHAGAAQLFAQEVG